MTRRASPRPAEVDLHGETAGRRTHPDCNIQRVHSVPGPALEGRFLSFPFKLPTRLIALPFNKVVAVQKIEGVKCGHAHIHICWECPSKNPLIITTCFIAWKGPEVH